MSIVNQLVALKNELIDAQATSDETALLNILGRIEAMTNVELTHLVTSKLGRQVKKLSKGSTGAVKVACGKVLFAWTSLIDASNEPSTPTSAAETPSTSQSASQNALQRDTKANPSAKATPPSTNKEGNDGDAEPPAKRARTNDDTAGTTTTDAAGLTKREEGDTINTETSTAVDSASATPGVDGVVGGALPPLPKDRQVVSDRLCLALSTKSDAPNTSASSSQNQSSSPAAANQTPTDSETLVTETEFEPSLVARRIEEAMFRKHGGVNQAYKNQFRALCFNIRNPKNPELRKTLLLGYIAANDLVEMDIQDLASDEMKAKREEARKWHLKAAMAVHKEDLATTDQFQCGRCKARKCTWYQMQTRSADEPMTTFVQCTNCPNRWKF